LEFAVARNPLFACTIGQGADGALAWQAPRQSPTVRWVRLDEPLDDTYGAEVDFNSPALRVWVRQGGDESRVLLHFHHACADAIGTFGFIEDFLVGYHNAFPGSTPIAPRLLEPRRLLGRGEIGMGGRSLLRQITDVFSGAREGLKFFLQRPAPLAARAGEIPPRGQRSPRPSFITVSLTEEATAGLRRAASISGATTNDVLMRDLFCVLRRWNAEYGGIAPGRRLRILMPQNLREREDFSMPVTNAMSFAFVTRKSRWCDRPDALLESIREETDAVRRGKLSLYFLGGLGSIRSAGLLRPVLRGPFCFATAILTNMGDPSRRFSAGLQRVPGGIQTGNLVYQSVLGVPPLRPNTHAAFCIANHGTTMSISYKWDHHRYNPQTGRQLLDDYVAQLEATARNAGPEVA
jgi:hypothetical protein